MSYNDVLWACTPSGKEIDIPILGVCGEFGSGKSMFAITIAPGQFPDGHPNAGKNRTGVIDVEKSTEIYAKMIPFDRIDLPTEVMKTRRTGYSPKELYQEFIKQIDKIPNNRYDVLVVDPITDIDSGMTEYVKTNCTNYGLTTKQVDGAQGLLWGVVKEEWGRLLLQIAQKCKTFVFTAHMRDVWEKSAKAPSGKREPKGKETLAKLATLYLKLDRKKRNIDTSPIPCGSVVLEKSRLCEMTIMPDGSVKIDELIPQAFDNCTPAKIRDFIRSPGTRGIPVNEDQMDNDTRLAYQAVIETNRNEANQAALELVKRQQELTTMHASASITSTPSDATPSQQKPQGLINNIFSATNTVSPSVTPPVADGKVETACEPEKSEPKPVPDPPFVPNQPTTETVTPSEIAPIGPAECQQNIYKAYTDKVFNDQERKQLCEREGVEKISLISDDKIINIWEEIWLVKYCKDLAVKMNMPVAKLDEWAAMSKQKSFFIANLQVKKNIRQVVETEAKKQGVDFVPF